jgi:hypothetical protein
MLFADKAGVGEERYQEAHPFEADIDLEKVLAEQRLSAGDVAPKDAHRYGLVGDLHDLIQRQLLGPGRTVVLRFADVAVTAVVVATGCDLQVKGYGTIIGFHLSPKLQVWKSCQNYMRFFHIINYS